jgi:hypothetical protein
MDVKQLHTEWHNTLWGVRRSQRYHAKRMQFFQRWSWCCALMSVLSGSGAVVVGFQKFPPWVAGVFAMLFALFGGLNLVFKFGDQVRDHKEFVRKFADLESRMRLVERSEADVRKFQAERAKLDGEESNVKVVLDVICHNEQAVADGASAWPHPVSWWQRLLSNYLSEYKPVNR